ncbi:DUF2279 domain-containing protein [Pontibacter qinzhouensis]|uniref:DUF2279 domain-containing protein n=1 Tax=Pontibacter qinzhouensis TaxID=2603253 RepID=A0A5C8K7Z5_9BACT|nr:DUF2279 domain-containing protein [Pontibacter qinzhouensis]TXK47553.1 DUF2279 domain-containing protein [Pontibacter qinzhouensis]
MFQYLLSFLLLVFSLQPLFAASPLPPDSVETGVNKKRLLVLGTGFGVGYAGMLYTLHHAWYKEQDRTSFHFFNDNHEWKQMDKAGHFWSAFHQSRAGIDLMRWAGLPDKKAIVYGGLVGVVLQTPIEIFDGFQSEYGASVGDLVANTVGSAAVVAQELAWREIRIMPKYSFHTTRYAAIRPNLLGSSLAEQALKDYNGQTYWLSVDVGAFLARERRYPRWLNLAVGYGAEEMVYNHVPTNRALGLHAYRQFYLSPDLNLLHFKGRNKLLNTALYVLSIVKIPAPALEFRSRGGIRFHPVYF